MKFIGISAQVLLVLLVVPTVVWAADLQPEPGMLVPKRDASLDGQPGERRQGAPDVSSSTGTKSSPAVRASTVPKRQIAALNRGDLRATEERARDAEALLKGLYGWRTTLAVTIESPVTSKTAIIGDMVEARLSQDFRFGRNLIATQNSLVRGHIVSIIAPRTLSAAVMSHERKFNSRACMTLQFDEIVDQDGRRWPIVATPCQQNNVITNRSKSGRQVKTDAQGRIVRASATLSQNQKTAYNATKVATMVPLPTTILINAIGVPAAMGVVGAASPSVAYNKPVQGSDSHTRTKAAAYAFVTNLPGAIFVQSVVEKGDEVELLPGDELMLNLAIRENGYRFPPSNTDLNVTGAVVVAPKKTNRLYPADQPAAQHSALLPAAGTPPASPPQPRLLPVPGEAATQPNRLLPAPKNDSASPSEAPSAAASIDRNLSLRGPL
jgi:hypothetical protein